MDDVTFSRNGRDAKTWKLHRAATAMSGVAIPGRSVMCMNACYNAVFEFKMSHIYLIPSFKNFISCQFLVELAELFDTLLCRADSNRHH